jgi:hypothetical protein
MGEPEPEPVEVPEPAELPAQGNWGPGVQAVGGVFRDWVVVPLGVVTAAEVALAEPGHQASNQPPARVAWTR